MSLHLEFEPHSYYRDFAIKQNTPWGMLTNNASDKIVSKWSAYTANGMTGHIVELEADTLRELKEQITTYTNNEKARIERLYK